MDSYNYLQRVEDGELHFADGTRQAIPNWGDILSTHLFCVRHAEKSKADPHDPDLTAEGEARAERLGRIMAGAGLNAVYTTVYRRAQLTAEPVSRRGNVPVVEIYELEEQDEWIENSMPFWGGERILIVGHQHNIPHLLNHLNGGGFDYDNIPDSDYGKLFIAITRGIGDTEVLELRY